MQEAATVVPLPPTAAVVAMEVPSRLTCFAYCPCFCACYVSVATGRHGAHGPMHHRVEGIGVAMEVPSPPHIRACYVYVAARRHGADGLMYDV